MTLILRTISLVAVLAILLASFFPVLTTAQTSMTLSVSPTLFEMTANPSQVWTSSVRVINSNPYEITIYADVANFTASGESGRARFIPILDEEADAMTLASWVRLEKETYTIPAEQTAEIPFQIVVPENAPPGGHFGAIMIGTKPMGAAKGQSAVETSQVVTALMFLRVTGDIVEEGVIREFRSTQLLSEKPEMSFELRFQNKGNVHILPQGEIRIFNMWGQERGLIPVNRQTMFGNVLPNSIRKYNFSWSGEWSLADMGRYTAVATLAYGDEGRQFADAETSFWVLPWKAASLVLGVIFGFLYLFTWAIKLYIRKMLKMAGVSPDAPMHYQPARKPRKQKVVKVDEPTGHTITNGKAKRISIMAPLEEGMLDLRARMNNSEGWKEHLEQLRAFVKHYKYFFLTTAGIVTFIVLLVWFIGQAKSERSFNVTIDGLEQDINLSSEQIEYESLKSVVSEADKKEDFPNIIMINRSGVPGLAAKWRLELEQKGYPVVDLTNELDTSEEKTVIVYDAKYTEEALQLSVALHGALLSANLEASDAEPIVIYIGNDLENAVE